MYLTDSPFNTFYRNAPEQSFTTRTILLRADSINEQTRSVDAIITTENPVAVFDFESFRAIDEVLITSGMRSPEQVPMLDNHQRRSIINVFGQTRNIRAVGVESIGTLFFDEDSDSDLAWNKVRKKSITDVSAGYRPLPGKFIDIPAGQSRFVNGKNYTAKDRTLRITLEWELREVSLTPIGADQAAKIRENLINFQFQYPHKETSTMNTSLRAYLESIGLSRNTTDHDAWEFYRNLAGENQTRAAALLGTDQVPAVPATPGQQPNNPNTPPVEPQRTETTAENLPSTQAVEPQRTIPVPPAQPSASVPTQPTSATPPQR